MKQCISCLSDNVSTVVKKNHIFYYCSNCKKKNSSVIDNDGINYAVKQNGLIKHTSVSALIEKEEKVLLIERKNYPFGFGIPSAHLHYGENLNNTLNRLFIDKIGLELKNKKLILNQTLVDPCRFGAELHDSYLFKCCVKDYEFTGTAQKLVWIDKNNLNRIDLIPNTKLLLSRIKLIKPSDQNKKEEMPVNNVVIKEGSIIDSLPLSVIIFSEKRKQIFLNSVAEKFFEAIKHDNKKNYDALQLEILKLVKKTISNKSSFANNYTQGNHIYNIVANTFVNDNKKCGASVIIKDITSEKLTNVNDLLTHNTSITLRSNTSFSTVVNTIMKQLFFSMNITGASLMLLENDTLSVAFRYSTTSKAKRTPLLLKVGEGVAGWVAKNKTMVAIPDTSKDPLYIGAPPAFEKSILAEPVISNDDVVGVLNLSKQKGEYFSEQEMRAAATIANGLAIAIENEKLYQKIKSDKKKTSSIIENSADGITTENLNGEILIWNKKMKEITGFSTPKAFIKTNKSVIRRIKSAIEKSAEMKSDSFYEEIEITTASGDKKLIGRTSSLVRNENKEVDFLIVQIKDLSKERSIEAQQKEFIYTTTHELRTPITVIKGYLSMFLNQDFGKINNAQKKYFSRIFDATERLVVLVEDLLAVAKVEEGEIGFEFAPYDIKTLCREIVREFKIKNFNRKVKITINRCKSDLITIGDRNRTKQAISNLVENAIKYTPSGTVKMVLDKQDNKYAVVGIEDTGVGIPQKEFENIFNRFYRVSNSESVKAGGTGLGLYIVKKLIEEQRGKIEVNSKLGTGTTFCVKLPIKK